MREMKPAVDEGVGESELLRSLEGIQRVKELSPFRQAGDRPETKLDTGKYKLIMDYFAAQ